MKHYARDWLGLDPHRIPERNPLAFFLFAWTAFSVFPTAIGTDGLPGSLSQGPDLLGQLTCTFMVIGCLVGALGIILPSRDRGIPLELAGTILFGATLFIYGLAVLTNSSTPNTRIIAGVCGGFWLGSIARSVQVLLYVNGRLREKKAQADGVP